MCLSSLARISKMSRSMRWTASRRLDPPLGLNSRAIVIWALISQSKPDSIPPPMMISGTTSPGCVISTLLTGLPKFLQDNGSCPGCFCGGFWGFWGCFLYRLGFILNDRFGGCFTHWVVLPLLGVTLVQQTRQGPGHTRNPNRDSIP